MLEMAILVVFFLLVYIFFRIKGNKYLIATFFATLVFYSFYVLLYQKTYLASWTYGIAGSDMLAYYKSAQQWYLYGKVPAQASTSVLFNGAGYALYIFILKFLLFYPNLGYTNVISLNIINFLVVYLAALKLYYVTDKNSYLYTLIICNVALYFSSVRILRDPLIFYLISSIYSCAISDKKLTNLTFLMYSVFLFLLRSYTILFIACLFLYKKRMFNTLKVFYVLFFVSFSSNVVRLFLSSLVSENAFPVLYSGNLWLSAVKFLLSPDIIDSFTKVTLTPNISTLTYFLLSLWLTYAYLTIAVGALSNMMDNFYLLNLFLLSSNSLIYGILYSGTNEPRHKLMILIPTAILASMSRTTIVKKVKVLDLVSIITILTVLFFRSVL